MIQSRFEKNAAVIVGKKWLKNLLLLVNKYETRWCLTGLKHLKNLSYNYVLYGKQGENEIVLKLALQSELQYFEGKALGR